MRQPDNISYRKLREATRILYTSYTFDTPDNILVSNLSVSSCFIVSSLVCFVTCSLP